ncbi:MAG: cob(I)yrinic acid a c-diamide adenosyltransferase [Alkalinema sp. CACIAM 70d]|uniref:P-loop NTPase family protein n=1 Tax=Alkalinema pantanalense TaxID=1620705 RepID=UPI000B71FF45|nr:MAG: cob(I)yrinic acid a c-diamide adenosyltransferase [Alkalinema sp. CACIAM 70d]
MVSQLQRPAVGTSRSLNLSIEGLVQVFTCPHRSFFTSVMAQALRIAGQGTPVLVVQFMKGGIGQGYDRPMQLGQHLDWVRCGITRCLDTPQVTEEEAHALIDLWQYTKRMVYDEQYDLVVLDELSVAMQFGLIPPMEVLDFIRKRPKHVDVILTGPDMPEVILDVADQITELRRSHQP